MTTIAISEGFRVCQSFLGAALRDDAKGPASDLSAMLEQVVGSVFALMEQYEPVWMNRTASEDAELFGFRFDLGLDPVEVNVERMIANFRLACTQLGESGAASSNPQPARPSWRWERMRTAAGFTSPTTCGSAWFTISPALTTAAPLTGATSCALSPRFTWRASHPSCSTAKTCFPPKWMIAWNSYAAVTRRPRLTWSPAGMAGTRAVTIRHPGLQWILKRHIMVDTLREIIRGALERLTLQLRTDLPPFLAALIILAAAFAAAWFCRWLVTRIFKGIEVDRWLRRSGLPEVLHISGHMRTSRIAARAAFGRSWSSDFFSRSTCSVPNSPRISSRVPCCCSPASSWAERSCWAVSGWLSISAGALSSGQ